MWYDRLVVFLVCLLKSETKEFCFANIVTQITVPYCIVLSPERSICFVLVINLRYVNIDYSYLNVLSC